MSASTETSTPRPGEVRLAELLAAVSLATDLADDSPLESALGDALTSLHLARLAGLAGEDLTDVYYLAGPKAAPVLVAADARSPAPHPTQPLIAAVGANGSLIVCGLEGQERRVLAEQGDHPQWSHDGLRLVAEEPVPGKDQIRYLKVYIFKLGGALSASPVAQRP